MLETGKADDLQSLESSHPCEGHIGKIPMADAFLVKIKGKPGVANVRRFSSDTVEFADSEDGKARTVALGANVTYRRLLNGLRVVGPGGKIKVFTDIDGKVAGYLRVWRSLKAGRTEPLMGIMAASEEFEGSPLSGIPFSQI